MDELVDRKGRSGKGSCFGYFPPSAGFWPIRFRAFSCSPVMMTPALTEPISAASLALSFFNRPFTGRVLPAPVMALAYYLTTLQAFNLCESAQSVSSAVKNVCAFCAFNQRLHREALASSVVKVRFRSTTPR